MNPAYYIIAFIVGIILCRLVFSIGTIVMNLQAQTKLLALMAQKLGSPEEDVIKIIGRSNMPKKKITEETLQK